jgi:hypothetical protein
LFQIEWCVRLKETEMIEWNDLNDDVKSLLSLLPSEQQMAREIILNAVDPITATGPRFSFDDREPFDVPHPCARVDLARAWTEARRDAEACRDLLDDDASLHAALRVYRNTIRWLQFWSLRFPDGRWREEFEAQLRVRVVGLNRLKDKAKWKFEIELMQALNNI